MSKDLSKIAHGTIFSVACNSLVVSIAIKASELRVALVSECAGIIGGEE